jgi:hypothetical protein
MKGSRSLLLAALGTLVLSGCKESIGQPLPLEEARQAGWSYPVYEMTPPPAQDPASPGRPIEADGRLWTGRDAAHRFYGPGYGTRIPQAQLRSIGTYGGVELYALTHDSPPYSRLYSPLGPGRWREYQMLTR